jgi:lipopolysaccharide transport system permease protein
MNEITIEAGRSEKQYWRDLWRYKELFYFLAWRDILVRYKQTVLGALWAILQPFTSMVVMSVVFGHLVHVPQRSSPADACLHF